MVLPNVGDGPIGTLPERELILPPTIHGNSCRTILHNVRIHVSFMYECIVGEKESDTCSGGRQTRSVRGVRGKKLA